MNRTFAILSMALSALLLQGCANTIKMPMKEDNDALTSAKPVYLVTLTFANVCRDRFQPSLDEVEVVRDDAAVKKNIIRFEMDSRGTYEFENERLPPRYLVRLELAPGPYILRGVRGSGRFFPINFRVYLPLQLPLSSSGPGIYYLGSIKASIRPRQDNEFRAGAVIPLIDQAVACASTGTFDVDISDSFDEDIELFKKSFPPLVSREIQKSLLPPFDRSKVQTWWEQN
jgi:hypothetical protein